MHAYRCKECTLYRCDGLDETCAECLAGLMSAAIKKKSAVDASMGHVIAKQIFTLSGTVGGIMPPAAVPASTTLVMIPGDFKHNALVASKALMNVDWSILHKFAVANGIPFPTKGGIADIHTVLQMYAMAPP